MLTVRNCWLISHENYYVSNDLSKGIQVFGALASVLLICQQWEFASQYLKVAVLFELSFQEQSEETARKRSNRKRMLHIVRIIAYTLFTVEAFTLLYFPIDQSHMPNRVFWTFSTVLITGILIYSMHRIKHYQK